MDATILIVNISPAFGKILDSFFKEQGFKVLVVQDGLHAFQRFIMDKVDLILTDYHMPGISGGDLVRTFRANREHKDLPIVVFTSSLSAELEQECKQAGASLVLDKSMPREQLIGAVSRLVEDYKQAHCGTGLDLDLAHSTIQATQEVIRTMMAEEVVAGKADFQKVQAHKADVIGSVGVAGFLSGSITLFLGRDLARVMTARLLMIEPEEVSSDEEIVDAIGEVTNMVAGNIKTHLFRKIPLFDISTPSVTMGQEVKRMSVASQLCFLVPFQWDDMQFLVEFLLVTREKGESGVSLALLTGEAG